MSFNPFKEKPLKSPDQFYSWKQLALKPYNKFDVDPYTRVRIILAAGAEFEAVWFGHQFHRHCDNNDLRREIAITRRHEQQQQKRIASLKPIGEGILEHTIGYEQLAVDLTAIFAQRESDKYVKMAMDFALLEDFDHLYRYADLLEMDKGIVAEKLVGGYTELMPARPTIAHHRDPCDTIRPSINNKVEDIITKLDVAIITAAEQQTMNYYMNIAQFYKTQKGRELYAEIGMVEEDLYCDEDDEEDFDDDDFDDEDFDEDDDDECVSVECPSCGEEVFVDETMDFDNINCPSCGAKFSCSCSSDCGSCGGCEN